MTKENLKGGEEKDKMEQELITVQKRIFKDKCPICSYEIVGTSESQVDFNMKIHLMTHKQ